MLQLRAGIDLAHPASNSLSPPVSSSWSSPIPICCFTREAGRVHGREAGGKDIGEASAEGDGSGKAADKGQLEGDGKRVQQGYVVMWTRLSGMAMAETQCSGEA